MSITLNFIEIERSLDSIITENKTCGTFEVNNEKIKKINEFYTTDSDGLTDLLKKPDTIWKGEIYNIPPTHHFLFLILALDLEEEVGYRDEEDYIISLAFEPKPILNVISSAINNIPELNSDFKKLKELLKHSVENNSLIQVYWG